jgi:hypothetical protein
MVIILEVILGIMTVVVLMMSSISVSALVTVSNISHATLCCHHLLSSSSFFIPFTSQTTNQTTTTNTTLQHQLHAMASTRSMSPGSNDTNDSDSNDSIIPDMAAPNVTALNIASANESTFPLFSMLPSELRIKIWHFAACSPLVVQISCKSRDIVTYEKNRDLCMASIANLKDGPQKHAVRQSALELTRQFNRLEWFSRPQPPAVLSVNRESRYEASKFTCSSLQPYMRAFYNTHHGQLPAVLFRYDIDILYLNEFLLSNRATDNFALSNNRSVAGNLSRIEHLAMDFKWYHGGPANRASILKRLFPALKTLLVVRMHRQHFVFPTKHLRLVTLDLSGHQVTLVDERNPKHETYLLKELRGLFGEQVKVDVGCFSGEEDAPVYKAWFRPRVWL